MLVRWCVGGGLGRLRPGLASPLSSLVPTQPTIISQHTGGGGDGGEGWGHQQCLTNTNHHLTLTVHYTLLYTTHCRKCWSPDQQCAVPVPVARWPRPRGWVEVEAWESWQWSCSGPRSRPLQLSDTDNTMVIMIICWVSNIKDDTMLRRGWTLDLDRYQSQTFMHL